MDDFPGNSHESRLVTKVTTEEQSKPKVESAVRSPAEQQKLPRYARVLRIFGATDGKSVVEGFVRGIIMPAARDVAIKTVDDIAHNFKVQVRAALGDNRPVPRSPSIFSSTGPVGNQTRVTQVPYNGYSKPSGTGAQRDFRHDPIGGRRPSARFADLNEWTMGSYAEAMDVLDVLRDMIAHMGFATVSDFKETIEVDAEHTDVHYGWTDLSSHSYHPMSAGGGRWRLNLPTPIYLAQR